MSLRRFALVLALASSLFGSTALAQPCVLDGRGFVERVRPEGTALELPGLEALTRVTLEGTQATLEVREPIVFRGHAPARSVGLRLRRGQTLADVVHVARGVRVAARRVEGAAWVHVAAGSTALALRVACEDLVFGDLPEVEDEAEPVAAAPAREARRLVHASKLPRGDTLRVFSSATGARGLTLRRRGGPAHGWPILHVVAWHPERARVVAELAPGITLDGWVARRDLVEAHDRGLWGTGSTGGCGVGYGGTLRYRGPAQLAADAPIRDDQDQVWARAAHALEVFVVVVERGARIDPSGERVPLTEVFVERLPGVHRSVCEPSPIRVRLEDLRYDSPPP